MTATYLRRWYMVFGCVLMIVLATMLTSAAPVKLQVAMWINDAREVAETQKILDEYERLNPNVKLELIQQGFSGYHEKMITLAASGIAPDVMVLSRAFLPPFAKNGMVQPIDKWLAKEKFDVQRDVAEIASGSFQGKVYGIPIWGGPGLLAVNTTLFDEVGEVLPLNLIKSNTWTWDRVVKAGKKLVRDLNGDGIMDRFALPAPGNWEPDWVAKIFAFGGEVINTEYTESRLDRPEAIRGLQFWADTSLTHHIAPRAGESVGTFEEGRLALAYSWAAESPNLAKRIGNKFAIDLAPMPAGPAGMFHVAGGCPVAISSVTKYADEAYKFATWFAMFSSEWQLRGIPASMAVIRREYRQYLSQFFKNPDAIIQALSNPTRMEPSVGLYRQELMAAWNPILNQMANGDISVENGAKEIARQINVILKGTK